MTQRNVGAGSAKPRQVIGVLMLKIPFTANSVLNIQRPEDSLPLREHSRPDYPIVRPRSQSQVMPRDPLRERRVGDAERGRISRRKLHATEQRQAEIEILAQFAICCPRPE